jgi:hypothetical protein
MSDSGRGRVPDARAQRFMISSGPPQVHVAFDQLFAFLPMIFFARRERTRVASLTKSAMLRASVISERIRPVLDKSNSPT